MYFQCVSATKYDESYKNFQNETTNMYKWEQM